ncbi:MAG: nuclear transport factor 2 family protein [Sphingomonadaceae bacterium]
MGQNFDLEAEVRDLAARRDITDAVQRYMRGLDRLDPAMQRSAFHDDAYIDVGLFKGGADDFVEFAQGLLAAMEATHHFLGQIRIEMRDAANASGECYFQAWHDSRNEDGAERDLFISGRYIDEYSCRDGVWRIAKRKLITDWITDDPANRAFWNQDPPPLAGGRRGEDFSDRRDWPD